MITGILKAMGLKPEDAKAFVEQSAKVMALQERAVKAAEDLVVCKRDLIELKKQELEILKKGAPKR